ncbi:hypothetical protein TNCV_2287381 [Trichonephila clavipes]|nr:hypothetical protein TNCV_2287381 [Trichonephila clavipes]
MDHIFSIGERSGKRAGQKAIQSGDCRRNFGQCVPRVVTHYPVEIWLWSSPEGKEGQLAPTPRRCSAGC